jgi:hypothetical protein
MSVKCVLIDEKTGQFLHTEDYELYGEDKKTLIVTTPSKAHGYFKTAAYTVQGTFEQISIPDAGSIELTDLIVTFEKKNTAVVTINFHDGTNTAPITKITLTDGPCNLVTNFGGRWRGWKNAHIDVIIATADAIGTVAIGYMRYTSKTSLAYDAWNAARNRGV